METYESPKITELGSVQDLTRSTIGKTSGQSDVIVIGNEVIPNQPGSTVTSVS